MQRRGAGRTDLGRKRVVNEDAFLCDDALGFYIVADGMGGHAAGEVASEEAIDTAQAMVTRERATFDALEQDHPSEEEMRRALRALESAVQGATYMVYAIAENDPTHQGMGTTMSALLLRGRFALTAQVGDSRIYRIHDRQPWMLTEDHTLVAWQIKQGLITEQEAANSPQRNVITRAVGSKEYVQVDTHSFRIEPGDTFVLCSDGVHRYLEDHEIAGITELGPSKATQRFIDLANQRGGRDNITAVVVETA